MRLTIPVSMAALGTILGGLAILLAGRAALAHPAAQGTGDPSSCLAVRHKVASPGVLLLGETVDITLTVSAVCAGEQRPLHIVLVLDGSASMAGAATAEMKQGARALIQSLDLRNNPHIRVGVVSFNSSANILCQLTDNASRASGCVGKVGAAGGSSINAGILAGIRVLVDGRRGVEWPTAEIREVMMVVADGPDPAGCGPVERAAGQAKGQGILLISLSGGPDSDVACMRSIASSPRHSLESTGPGHMADVFAQAIGLLQEIRTSMTATALSGLSVTDRLPPNMALVPGSVDPAPSVIGPVAGELTWRFAFVPPDGVTLTLRVRPLEAGTHPTNAGATGVLTDTLGRTAAFAFPDPEVRVLAAPTARPTATGLPTATGMPTPTGTPAPAASPTPTADAHRGAVYVPIALAGALP